MLSTINVFIHPLTIIFGKRNTGTADALPIKYFECTDQALTIRWYT